MLAPVIVFVFNRPYHTERVLKKLSENTLAKESDLTTFPDGPRNKIDERKVFETREIIEGLELDDKFKSVRIYKSERNQGLAKSVISGVTKIIDRAEKVIVLKDDLITHPLFLEFMNKCLNYYENDNQIWSISGFNIP